MIEAGRAEANRPYATVSRVGPTGLDGIAIGGSSNFGRECMAAAGIPSGAKARDCKLGDVRAEARTFQARTLQARIR